MATKGEAVKAVPMNAVQAMCLSLCLVAAEGARAAGREGGYRPAPEDVDKLSKALREAVVAMMALIDDWSAVNDDQLEGAARDLGRLVLREVLGPAPQAN